MNKKGQVLVVFLLLLPLIFLFMFYIYDIGNMYYQKAKLKSTLKDSLIYLLNNPNTSETKVTDLAKKNIKDINISITKLNDKIKIEGFIELNTNLLKKQKIKVIMYGRIDQDNLKIWEE